jgi:hypothetical protein
MIHSVICEMLLVDSTLEVRRQNIATSPHMCIFMLIWILKKGFKHKSIWFPNYTWTKKLDHEKTFFKSRTCYEISMVQLIVLFFIRMSNLESPSEILLGGMVQRNNIH